MAPPPTAVIIPPAGTAAGFFVAAPVFDGSRPPGILADKVDPTTGEILDLFVGRDPVDAALEHQMAIKASSGAAVKGGQAFESIRKNTDHAPSELKFEAQRIAKPFVDRGLIGSVKYLVNATDANGDPGDEGDVFIVYENRLSGARDQRIPVNPS